MDEKNAKSSDWQELTQLSQGQPMVVERVRLPEKDIVIEGSFEEVSRSDDPFVRAFLRPTFGDKHV